MKITQTLLDKLTSEAKESPRLRMNYDLRNSDQDQSQRMLNAIEPGSPLPIHRHRKTSETVVCLRGHLREIFYDDNGKEIELNKGKTMIFIIKDENSFSVDGVTYGQDDHGTIR
jgi:cupin fold WbuC family metalloprotein